MGATRQPHRKTIVGKGSAHEGTMPRARQQEQVNEHSARCVKQKERHDSSTSK